jgi:large subunit ribosomal protein L4
MATTVKLPAIDLKGKDAGLVEVPANVFAAELNEAVVHFVCEGQRFRFYKKNNVTKGRSQVSGGGKKIIKQKGSGGARHGGNRSPIHVGGGVALNGPKGVKRNFKVNKKLYNIALASVLSDRTSGGQVRVLKAAELKAPKTQSLVGLLEGLKLKGARVGFVVSRKGDEALAKSVRNIRNVDLLTEEHWTTLDFVKTDSLIFSEGALKGLTSRFKA